MARRRGRISPVPHKIWEFQTWNSETVLIKGVRMSWIAQSLFLVAPDNFVQRSCHVQKSFLAQTQKCFPHKTSYMGNPALNLKSVDFPVLRKIISNIIPIVTWMNFYACGTLQSDTPQAILAGGCIRMEIWKLCGRRFIHHGSFHRSNGANDCVHHGHLPNIIWVHHGHFTMGTNDVRSCAVDFV